jgi:hypothetical protein
MIKSPTVGDLENKNPRSFSRSRVLYCVFPVSSVPIEGGAIASNYFRPLKELPGLNVLGNHRHQLFKIYWLGHIELKPLCLRIFTSELILISRQCDRQDWII